MTMAIKQHWVPRFYLRGFATSLGSDKVWVTNIKNAYNRIYAKSKKSVADVAHHRHLYSLPCDDGTFQPQKANNNGWDDSVDKALQQLESRAGPVWARFHDLDHALDLTPGSEERTTVAIFLASLHLRNPRMVAVSKLAVTQLEASRVHATDAFYEAVAGVSVDFSPTLAGVLDRTEFLAVQMCALRPVAARLSALHWKVHYFSGMKAAGPLVTTDTPIFFVNRGSMEPCGLDSSDCAVFCALSSRVLFMATRAKTDTHDGEISEGKATVACTINPFIVHYGQQEAYSGFELGEGFPFLR